MKIPRLSKFQPIKILWRDAVGDRGTWEAFDDYDFDEHARSSLHLSCGFFLKECRETLFFCQSYRPEDEQIGGRMSIPTVCVIKIKRLKE